MQTPKSENDNRAPLSPLGREVFDMMNQMNGAFAREFKNTTEQPTEGK